MARPGGCCVDARQERSRPFDAPNLPYGCVYQSTCWVHWVHHHITILWGAQDETRNLEKLPIIFSNLTISLSCNNDLDCAITLYEKGYLGQSKTSTKQSKRTWNYPIFGNFSIVLLLIFFLWSSSKLGRISADNRLSLATFKFNYLGWVLTVDARKERSRPFDPTNLTCSNLRTVL